MKRQRGAVLVMALLVVAMVAAMAASMASHFQLSLAKGENRWHGGQARVYLQGAETIALQVLKDDKVEYDHLEEDWAQPSSPLPIDGGWLQAELRDAQARFNLNSLNEKIEPLSANPEGGQAARFSEPQRRFIRLLQTVEEPQVSEAQAIEIVEALVDWIDADSDVTGYGGAEQYHYQQSEPAYQPANQSFFSVSELRLIKGVTPEIYKALAPLLVVLPDTHRGMNIHTLPLELMRTLGKVEDLSPLSVEDAQLLIDVRDAKVEKEDSKGNKSGFGEVTDFLEDAEVESLLGAAAVSDGLTVASSYFEVVAQVQLIKQRRQKVTLLNRDNGNYSVVRRQGQ